MMVTGINETVMLANMKLHYVLSTAAVALLSIFAGAVRSNEAIITSEDKVLAFDQTKSSHLFTHFFKPVTNIEEIMAVLFAKYSQSFVRLFQITSCAYQNNVSHDTQTAT